jgi:hypothetical protein
MFDQILESFRKATESAMKLQQETFHSLTEQLAQVPGAPIAPAPPPTPAAPDTAATPPLAGLAWIEQVQTVQKQWAQVVTELLKKNSETLDAQYKAGVKSIEEAFNVGRARDPAEFKRLTEELWRHSFESLKKLAEDQVHECQAASAKWTEAASKSFPTQGKK